MTNNNLYIPADVRINMTETCSNCGCTITEPEEYESKLCNICVLDVSLPEEIPDDE